MKKLKTLLAGIVVVAFAFAFTGIQESVRAGVDDGGRCESTLGNEGKNCWVDAGGEHTFVCIEITSSEKCTKADVEN